MLIASEIANVAPSALAGKRPYRAADFEKFFDFGGKPKEVLTKAEIAERVAKFRELQKAAMEKQAKRRAEKEASEAEG